MTQTQHILALKESRRRFRWARALFWTTLITAACALGYLTFVGVPDFVKARLQDELQSRGIALEIGRARLRGFRTFLIERVELGKTESTNGPQLRIDRAEVRLNGPALSRLNFQPESLRVRQGQLTWPIVRTNEQPAEDPSTNRLTIDDITTELRFPATGDWHLDQLRGKLRNADVDISARITNATALRPARSDPARKPASDWIDRINPIVDQIQRCRFDEPSVLSLHIEGDGRDPGSFRLHLNCQVSGADSPWGKLEKLKLAAILSPDSTNSLKGQLRLSCAQAEMGVGKLRQVQLTGRIDGFRPQTVLNAWDCQISLADAQTPWGKAEQLQIAAQGVRDSEIAPATHQMRITVDAGPTSAPKFKAGTLRAQGTFHHTLNSWNNVRGEFTTTATDIGSDWAGSRKIRLNGHIQPRNVSDAGASSSPTPAPASSRADTDTSWGPWRFLAPVRVDTSWEIDNIESATVRVDRVDIESVWMAPDLAIRRLDAQLYGGQFHSTAHLNTGTRELSSSAQFNFDAHQISPLLTTNAQRWLGQFQWETPPSVKAEMRLILPAWTNRAPNWRQEVLPTIQLAGEFEGQSGSFRNVSVTRARSRFSMSNQFWRLPDLTVVRPEGTAQMDYHWWMNTQDYFWKIQSGIDPKALRPVLDPPEQKILDEFKFTAPPRIDGQIWGRWHDRARIGFEARVAGTNFAFRGEPFTTLAANLQFTNKYLRLSDIALRSGNQHAKAAAAGFDPVAHLFFVTNAISTFDPDIVGRLIGPKTRAALKPYQFRDPPTVIINGQLPTHREADADVKFQVSGKAFQYWKFQVPEASADVHWNGDWLSITNLNASFYNGRLNWDGQFDFSVPRAGADFKFNGRVTKADLSALMADLTGKTNHLEGQLSGTFSITSANSEKPDSWTGHGNFRLRDGFLWNIPIFGVFSPILDKLTPGFGNSKITSGSAGFKLAQGLIRTDNLELRSTPVRLQYAGTVDLKGNVDARVQAEILRDAWAVGRFVSLALWPVTKIFEYKVSGSLNEPKSEPLYLPKFVLWPFQPFRVMRQIFEPSDQSALIPKPPPDSENGGRLERPE